MFLSLFTATALLFKRTRVENYYGGKKAKSAFSVQHSRGVLWWWRGTTVSIYWQRGAVSWVELWSSTLHTSSYHHCEKIFGIIIFQTRETTRHCSGEYFKRVIFYGKWQHFHLLWKELAYTTPFTVLFFGHFTGNRLQPVVRFFEVGLFLPRS